MGERVGRGWLGIGMKTFLFTIFLCPDFMFRLLFTLFCPEDMLRNLL